MESKPCTTKSRIILSTIAGSTVLALALVDWNMSCAAVAVIFNRVSVAAGSLSRDRQTAAYQLHEF